MILQLNGPAFAFWALKPTHWTKYKLDLKDTLTGDKRIDRSVS